MLLDPAVDDPAAVHSLIDAHAPYWPVQRYFANDAEYAALSGRDATAGMVVAPVFRGNWAADGVVREGVAPLLHSPRFVAAARRLFDAEIVVPTTVYVNLTYQLPFPQGAGHTDVPVFRGFDRTRHPITLLTIMGLSGLFEDVRVKVATAVVWFYAGADGGFEYWPDGPDRPSRVHEGRIDNTAIVGDNDVMWHRVRPTGALADGMPALTMASELTGGGNAWTIVDGGRELAAVPRERLRVSVSWKALVFESDAERRRWAEHTDDIDLAEVLRRFRVDLAARGIAAPPSGDDPERDPAFIRLLHQAYVRHPDANRPETAVG
ncbi:MAG TPA: hypothetical protein VNO26_15755 [Candidatus Limnocylindria bacterium]|nr:hypothetical protein [Candidatus Limnocylindria bacterium]